VVDDEVEVVDDEVEVVDDEVEVVDDEVDQLLLLNILLHDLMIMVRH
jgi:hypothetical protein